MNGSFSITIKFFRMPSPNVESKSILKFRNSASANTKITYSSSNGSRDTLIFIIKLTPPPMTPNPSERTPR